MGEPWSLNPLLSCKVQGHSHCLDPRASPKCVQEHCILVQWGQPGGQGSRVCPHTEVLLTLEAWPQKKEARSPWVMRPNTARKSVGPQTPQAMAGHHPVWDPRPLTCPH